MLVYSRSPPQKAPSRFQPNKCSAQRPVTQGHTKNQVRKEDRGKGHEGTARTNRRADRLDSQQLGKGVDELQHATSPRAAHQATWQRPWPREPTGQMVGQQDQHEHGQKHQRVVQPCRCQKARTKLNDAFWFPAAERPDPYKRRRLSLAHSLCTTSWCWRAHLPGDTGQRVRSNSPRASITVRYMAGMPLVRRYKKGQSSVGMDTSASPTGASCSAFLGSAISTAKSEFRRHQGHWIDPDYSVNHQFQLARDPGQSVRVDRKRGCHPPATSAPPCGWTPQ